jgi:hypothetical protein
MPNFYNLIRAQKFSTVSDTAIEIGSADSATPHFSIDAGGKLNWGSLDTNLYRSTANTLKTDDSLVVAGTVDVQQVREKLNDSTVSTNVMTCNFSTGAIFYNTTTLSANFTANITNAPTDNGYVVTITIIINQGSSAYYPNALQIAGSSQTIKWPNANALPTPTPNKIDVFTFTLIRRSSAWTVLGSYILNF